MAKNLKAIGEVFDWPATAAVKSGDLVAIGDTHGVVLTDGAVGDVVSVRVEGVFELPKAAGAAIDQGAAVYWDGTAIAATDGAGANARAGVAYVAAAADDTTVQVKLNA